MNINYEINNILVNSDNNIIHKYIYRNNEIPDELYIFEIELIDINNNSHFIRKIIKNLQGKIPINNLYYDNIIQYSVLIINVNNINNIIMIKGHFNNNKIVDNNITINFLKSFDNSIICNYLL